MVAMKRAPKVISAWLLGILIAAIIIWSAGSREPTYNGRTLSSWLNQWGAADYDRTNPAATAIRAIGTNGLPFLLERLSKDESPAERRFWRFATKFVPESFDPLNREVTRAVGAAEAINLLGPEAKSAFPALTNLMADKRHCIPAAIGLAGMGEKGIAVLLCALTNQNWQLRLAAAEALPEAGSDFDKIIPALINAVKTGVTNKEGSLLRGSAGSALVRLHRSPNLVVPVFSQFLTNSNAGTRAFGASLLGGFGTDAKEAVPLLLKMGAETNVEVREAALRALREIDPKAAGEHPR